MDSDHSHNFQNIFCHDDQRMDATMGKSDFEYFIWQTNMNLEFL